MKISSLLIALFSANIISLSHAIAMSGINLTPSDSQHVLIQDGWFSEKETMWPG
jgi:hypothetical protein